MQASSVIYCLIHPMLRICRKQDFDTVLICFPCSVSYWKNTPRFLTTDAPYTFVWSRTNLKFIWHYFATLVASCCSWQYIFFNISRHSLIYVYLSQYLEELNNKFDCKSRKFSNHLPQGDLSIKKPTWVNSWNFVKKCLFEYKTCSI